MTVLFAQQNGNWNTNNIWNTQSNGTGSFMVPTEYDICVSNGYTIVVNENIKVLQLRSDAYQGATLGGDFTFDTGIVVDIDTYSLVNSKILTNMKGPRGNPGLSAYELATQNGFTGTVQEWLTSLIGSSGSSGLKGFWNDSTTYAIDDMVFYENQLFIATAESINSPPLTITTGSAFPSESDTPTINYDGTPKEVGIGFIANYDLILKGVKFYKPTNNSYTSIGIKLWADKVPLGCRFKYVTETGWVSIYFDKLIELHQNCEYQVSINLDHIVSNADEFVGDGDRGLITTIYNSGRVTGDWVINAYPYNGSTTGYYVYPIVERQESNSNWTKINLI